MDDDVLKKVDAFFSQFKPQIYKKSEVLIRADDPPSGIFYLKTGLVREYAISKRGDELVVNVFKPYSFFPMSWAMNDTKNQYYFEALEKSEIHKAPREKVLEFIKENPDVLYDLVKRIYHGTDGMMMRLVHLLSGSAYEKLISDLVIHAKRFGEPVKGGIELLVTEKDLASESGLTRETVSREIKVLKEKGLITFHLHMLIIPSLEKLEKELL